MQAITAILLFVWSFMAVAILSVIFYDWLKAPPSVEVAILPGRPNYKSKTQ
jgi:uncharacterized membrane protein YedE/YeeE